MDYLGEIIALGIDGIIFGVSLKQYFKYKNAIQLIQGAPFLEIDDDLKQAVINSPNRKIPYVAIRGVVEPIGTPIRSLNKSDIYGVVQKLSIKEHVIERTHSGFWGESKRIIEEVYNCSPFNLTQNDVRIEVIDPLAAQVMDLDTISDNFEPSKLDFIDHLWSFFAGRRQRGLQNTEEMLRTGSLVTGIGELCCSMSGKTIRLQPPDNGDPFYLTTMPVTSLVRKIDSAKHGYGILVVIFGTVGVLIGGLVFRRYWKDRKRRLQEQEIQRRLEQTRVERRRKARNTSSNTNDPDAQLCVVCKENPREIIILPCGHVCICEDCSLNIFNNCPVCRADIENKAPAYLS